MVPFHRSLRFRVAMAFVLLSVSINSVLTLALRVARERSLLKAVDTRLGKMSESLSQLAAEDGVEAFSSSRISEAWKSGLTLDSWFVLVRDRNQQLIASSGTSGDAHLPDSVWDQFTVTEETENPSVVRAKIISLPVGALSGDLGKRTSERARAQLLVLRPRPAETYYVLIGVSMAVPDSVTATLGRTLLLTACGATVAAGLAGWVVASLLAARVKRITNAMRSVTPKALSAGLKVPEGTDEIGQVGAALNSMLAGLDKAFRSQERFISDVSHELKTPLAALLIEAQVLLSGEPSEVDYRAFVTSTEDEARRLGKLVESFLMLTRFDHGKRFVADELVSLNEVALDAIRHSQIFANQTHVSVLLNIHEASDDRDEALVRGDFELLRIAVDNVLRNAVQISKPGDSIEMTIATDGGKLTIAVRDHGPGVHPDYLERIFDRFQQAPSREPSVRGTGLGLAIAKGIIELHAGTIFARNHAEGGCVFTIVLPLAVEPNRKPASSTSRS